MRLLVVEDDVALGERLRTRLVAEGYAVDLARDGIDGAHLGATEPYDAVILDLGLPGKPGLAVLREWRAAANRVPVLILTARDVLDDKLAAFDCGADDYLVKPFALREVEARLKALVSRRRGRVVDRKLVAGPIEFDTSSLAVSVDGRPVHLSRKCLRLLEMMMTAPNRVYSRAELEQALWGDEHPQSDSLRSHMHLLRRALTDGRGHSPIETVHGVGYRFASADVRST